MNKTRIATLSVLLATLALTAFAVETDEKGPAVGKHESVECEVLNVYSAKLGTSVYRSYLIKWQDQEVVASDPLAKTNYKVGDKISVLVMNHAYPKGKAKPGLLHFTVPR